MLLDKNRIFYIPFFALVKMMERKPSGLMLRAMVHLWMPTQGMNDPGLLKRNAASNKTAAPSEKHT